MNQKNKLIFNTDKSDGAPRKLLDVGRLHALGWEAQVHLHAGLVDTYEWFKKNLTAG